MLFKLNALLITTLGITGLSRPGLRFGHGLYITALWLWMLLAFFLIRGGAVSWSFLALAALAFLSDFGVRALDNQEKREYLKDSRERDYADKQSEASQRAASEDLEARIKRIESNQVQLNNIIELASNGPSRF